MKKKLYFAFRGGEIMLEKRQDGTFMIPCCEEPPVAVAPGSDIMGVTTAEGTKVWTYDMADVSVDESRYEMCGLRASYYKLTDVLYRIAGKCEELLYWSRNTQFCGTCGGRMKMHTDISKRCEKCGREVWPQLSTAVIVLIRKGEEVLLVHARNFRGNFFGLVAGFVETGETLEEAVEREVLEETGLRIRNIRYFGSQSWPYPCGLMVGFNAEYQSGDIHLQDSEIAAGAWFRKDNLPEIPEKLSIARKLIDNWLDETAGQSRIEV